MRTFDVSILVVPGWQGAGPDHWQTRWLSRLRTASLIAQDDWLRPSVAHWGQRLVDGVGAAERPVVLVAHDCGVAAVVHAAAGMPAKRVAGAFLVAPVAEDVARSIPDIDPAFTPFPSDPLPFPSLLVASRNDPRCSFEAAGDMALSWGSLLVDAGDAGHLDAASGNGPWPEGAMRFGWFLKNLADPRCG